MGENAPLPIKLPKIFKIRPLPIKFSRITNIIYIYIFYLIVGCFNVFFVCLFFSEKNVFLVWSIKNTCTLQLFWCSFIKTYCTYQTMRALKQIEPRVKYLILEHLFFWMGQFIFEFSFCSCLFCLCLCLYDLLCFFVAHQKYMHIANVLVLFLLNILYLSSFLSQFMTYCKMLLFSNEVI